MKQILPSAIVVGCAITIGSAVIAASIFFGLAYDKITYMDTCIDQYENGKAHAKFYEEANLSHTEKMRRINQNCEQRFLNNGKVM